MYSFLVFLFAITSLSAFAGRTQLTAPLAAGSVQWIPSREDNQGPSSTGCTIVFRMANVSPIAQNVSVQLLDHRFTGAFGLLNRTGLSGWDTSSDPFWISAPKGRAVSDVKTVALGGLQGGSVSWWTYQRGTNSATGGFAWDGSSIPQPWTQFHRSITGTCKGTETDAGAANKVCAAGVNTEFRAKVTVAEDRGAVIASLSVSCTINNASDEIRNDFNYTINGGRPF